MTMDMTEGHIVEQLRRGENAAYKLLFDRHYAVMCHVAEQYVTDDFLAETIAGDVIFRLWENRASLQVHTSLRAYLLKAVRNASLDLLKSQHERYERSTSRTGLAVRGLENYAEDGDHPLGRLLSNELEERVATAIDRLPDDCRRVFRLSRFEGKTNREIAAELGISVNTVKYHLKRALSLLRIDLHEYLLSLLALFLAS